MAGRRSLTPAAAGAVPARQAAAVGVAADRRPLRMGLRSPAGHRWMGSQARQRRHRRGLERMADMDEPGFLITYPLPEGRLARLTWLRQIAGHGKQGNLVCWAYHLKTAHTRL